MQLRIRIGASVDRSLDVAYKPLVDSAAKASAAIGAIASKQARTYQTETKKGTDAAEKEFAKLARDAKKWQEQQSRSAATEAKKATDAQSKEYQRAAREVEKWEREKTRSVEKASKDRTRATEKAARDEERERNKAAASESRAADRAMRERKRSHDRDERDRKTAVDRARGIHNNIATMREGHSGQNRAAVGNGLKAAGGIALGAARSAGGFAMDAARDMIEATGVDTSLGSIFKKNVELESTASAISNSGYIRGDARNGKRVDGGALMQDAIHAGSATGTDANDALKGLEAFTGKTGDLATGREILKDMAVYAKASGTSLEDMVSASGDVALALGDVDNKGDKIRKVMLGIAAQGKLGAVEIKDLAKDMPKIAAMAGQMEGDVGENILMMGAFAQEARQRGGASSATQAAGSANSLINTFKTPARARAFEAATGQKAFNESGMLRNPKELVIEALRATGMNPTEFKKIFSNVQGARAVEGFATIYRQNGGGDAGEKAVREEFERLRKATMDDVEVMTSFQNAMATSEAQANVFNNSIRESALELQNNFKPAIQELAPIVKNAASDLAGVINQVLGHDAATRAEVTKSGGDIASDMTETNKQVQQGYVLDQQVQKNYDDEQAAKVAFNGARVRSAEGRRNATGSVGRTLAAVNDVINPAAWLGFGAKDSIKKEDAQQQGRVDQEADARHQLEDIKTHNKELNALIRNHIISVKIVKDETKKGKGPPALTGDGRTPSPDGE